MWRKIEPEIVPVEKKDKIRYANQARAKPHKENSLLIKSMYKRKILKASELSIEKINIMNVFVAKLNNSSFPMYLLLLSICFSICYLCLFSCLYLSMFVFVCIYFCVCICVCNCVYTCVCFVCVFVW